MYIPNTRSDHICKMAHKKTSSLGTLNANEDYRLKRWLTPAAQAGLLMLLLGGTFGSFSGKATAGPVPAECQTIGAVGSSGACNGLLIVDRSMLLAASHTNNSGDNSFNFAPGDPYTSHTSGTFDFSQVYTANITDMSYIFDAAGWIDVDISG